MLDRVLGALAVVPFVMGAAAAPVSHARVAFTFQDPEITESSGLVVYGDLAITVNDSGDSGRVFTVDTSTGKTVGTTQWSDDAVDDEALAPVLGHTDEVWVGDIGDNTERRDSIEVHRVPVSPGDHLVSDTAYELVYPDGPHNAETLMSDPTTGQLYVATKGVLGGELYAAPSALVADEPNPLTPVGPVLPIATDGAFLPDGRHVVIRNYSVATVYDFPSLEPVGTFPLPTQAQGEGLAVVGDDRLLLSSEGVREGVLRARIPASIRSAITPSPAPSSSPSPSDSGHVTVSRENTELPEATDTSASAWPWALTGVLGVGFIIVLTRSMRRH